MAYPEHVLFNRETAFGTWVSPTKCIPVEEWSFPPAREQVKLDLTGAGRGRYQTVQGAKPVAGSMRFPWWGLQTGSIIVASLCTTAPTLVAAGIYDHGCLFDDTAGVVGLSMQGKYSAALGLNVLSAVPSKWTFTMAAKQAAMVAIDLLAKDEARVGQNWDYTASPSSAILNHTYPTMMRPLMFYDATLILGGTPTLSGTTKLWSIGSGTTYSKFSLVEVSVDLGLDADAFALTTDPTIQEAFPGHRTISIKLESSWTDLSTVFYDAFRAGTEMALQIKLAGPIISTTYKHEGEITIPNIHFDPDAIWPAISGAQARPKSAISGEAVLNVTAGYDFGIRLRSSEATL